MMHNTFKSKYGRDEKKRSGRGNEEHNKHSASYYKNIKLKAYLRPEERDILLKKVPLSDGKYGDMVSCYKVQNCWRYVCNVCNVNVESWKPLNQHLQGKKHEENLDLCHKFANVDESNVSRRKKAHSPLRQNNSRIKPLMSTVIDPPLVVTQNNRNTQIYDREVFNKDTQNPDNYDYNRQSTSNFTSTGYDRSNNFHIQNDREQEYIQKKILESPNTYTRFKEEEGRFYEYIQSVDSIDIWQKYQEGVKLIEVNLLHELKYYQEIPWKHPKYDEERIAYQKRRNEELILMGEDPRNYDIKVEWDLFWDIRLNELFKEIFEKEKAQLRQNLQFSFTLDKTSQNEAVGHKTCELNKKCFNYDSKDEQLSSYGHVGYSEQTLQKPVIPVLRKLSVLEQNLGSLGPKVIDLLSTALTLEKSSENVSVAILSSEENYVLLETVMEKLKGFLQSGLLSEAVATLTESAVHSINELLSSFVEGEKLVPPIENKSLSQSLNKFDFEQLSDLKRYDLLFDKQQKFPSDRRPYSTEQRSKPIERSSQSSVKMYCGERRNESNERFSNSGKRNSLYSSKKTISGQRSTRSNKKRYRSKEKSFPRELSLSYNEMRPNSIEQQQLVQINSHSGKNMTQSQFHFSERETHRSPGYIYNDERQINKDVFVSDRINQNHNFSVSRNIKVSEIIMYIEKLRNLSHLTILQRTAISQQIASLLLVRGIVEITEDELLLLIKTLTPNSAQSNVFNPQLNEPLFKPVFFN